MIKQHNYEDIINLPHPESKKHKRMSAMNRAAQFAPFAALTGFEDDIAETGRITDIQCSLDENKQEILNHRLQLALEDKNRVASIKYFVPDESKPGGSYTYVTGSVKKVDSLNRCIVMNQGESVLLDRVVDIEFLENI